MKQLRKARTQKTEEPEISATPARIRTAVIPDEDDTLGEIPYYGPRKNKAKEVSI
jgi:hypothetical protein